MGDCHPEAMDEGSHKNFNTMNEIPRILLGMTFPLCLCGEKEFQKIMRLAPVVF